MSDNETNQLWRDVKKQRSQYKDNNRNLFASLLDDLKDTHKVVKLTEYQYRIDDILDIYPSNKKWHLIPSNERGQFRNVQEIKDKLV